MSEHDPLDELRAAWGSLEAPDATPEVSDPETEAVVESLRAAWLALEPPAVQVPARLRFRVLREQVPVFTRLAAAALLLAGAAIVARALLTSAPQRANTTNEARAEVPPRAHGEGPVEADHQAEHARAVQPAQSENGIVMTHGKVRLVMLTPEPTLDSLEGVHDPENPK